MRRDGMGVGTRAGEEGRRSRGRPPRRGGGFELSMTGSGSIYDAATVKQAMHGGGRGTHVTVRGR